MTTGYITPAEKILKIDVKELDKLRKALIPDVSFEIPKGYYTSNELSKILKLSKANINKRLVKLEKSKKVDKILGYNIRSNGRKNPVPYYKILD
jgi:Fic family protein